MLKDLVRFAGRSECRTDVSAEEPLFVVNVCRSRKHSRPPGLLLIL